MTDKNINIVAENIKKQIKAIQHHTVKNEVVKLNSIILGVHNYYSIATMCNIDFHRVYFLVKPTMNRLKKNYTRGHPTNAIYLKLYGNYTTNIYNIAGIDVFPLYGVVLKKTLSFKQEICNYTKEGRNLIHSKLNDSLQVLMEYLLENRDEAETVKFNDNHISKLVGQNGKSFISGMKQEIGNMVCCRKLPKNKDGTDDYENLVWITVKEQELITYFSGNAHLLKYNICGWLICGEWKLADVVVKEEGDNHFIHICKQFSTKKGGCAVGTADRKGHAEDNGFCGKSCWQSC